MQQIDQRIMKSEIINDKIMLVCSIEPNQGAHKEDFTCSLKIFKLPPQPMILVLFLIQEQ